MEKKNQLNEIKSLIDRMDNPRTGWGQLINEISTKWRDITTDPSDFYDILTSIPDGQRMTFGYVSAAKVVIPKTKILNQTTNRMNTVDDYEAFGQQLGVEGNVCGIFKLAIYNFPWQTEKKVSDAYNSWKGVRDPLAQKYGIEVDKARYGTQKMDYGNKGGISSYNGDNSENQGHTYTNINMYGIKPIASLYYLIMDDGSIQEIEESKLEKIPYKPSETIIDKLINAGATQDEVAPLKEMDYRRFEHSHMLFFSGSKEGVPTVFINKELSSKINNLNVSDSGVQNIINIAMERYGRFDNNI